MNTAQVDNVLAEYEHIRPAGDDPALAAVRTAIFVEDAFGVTLTDDQISPDVLGDPAALRTLVLALTRRA